MSPKTKWVEDKTSSAFTIDHLPYCIFRRQALEPWRVGVGIGSYVLDLYRVAKLNYLDEIIADYQIFKQDSLNPLIETGKKTTISLRQRLMELLEDYPPESIESTVLAKIEEVELKLPLMIGDYTDFYSSKEHATNVGTLFRDPEHALNPNWLHLPVAYHGRSSSINISGTPIYRPKGQFYDKALEGPRFDYTEKLDFELEIGMVIGKNSQQGETISTSEASEYIFGITLFNDWSARDIQRWEYVPLGPFLGKSFASTISPWITPIEALQEFKVSGPEQNPKVLPYLQYEGPQNYDITLEVWLKPETEDPIKLSTSNTKYLYWNFLQQIAHHTSNGCNLKVGDIMATGTISGPEPGSFGSLLELSHGGKIPLDLGNGINRTFLEDGDTLIMKAFVDNGKKRFELGSLQNQIFRK